MMKSFNEGERIYQLKDPNLCPYNSFVSYTDKLNSYNCKLNKDLDILWKRPNNKSKQEIDKVAQKMSRKFPENEDSLQKSRSCKSI